MSSRFPADVRSSLEEFSRRGGLTGPHKDGWGIAWYVDEDVRLIKEPQAGADSACVRFVQDHPFTAATVVSHIRKATRGAVAMKNCQPFARELGGRMHVFAHNGDLDLARLRAQFPLTNFHSIGDTDSEYAFCGLLERLRDDWLRGQVPSLGKRAAIIAAFAVELRHLGPANFIYSDGDAVFFHGHKRHHADASEPRPPGLHVLCRRCTSPRLAATATATDQETPHNAQEGVLAASVPLTGERGWRALADGELVIAQAGRVVAGCSVSGRRVNSRSGEDLPARTVHDAHADRDAAAHAFSDDAEVFELF